MATKVMTRVLDLADYRGDKQNRVLSGREKGEMVRHDARVAELDGAHEPVEVRVPRDLFSVTSSFFLGMFGPSIRSLGEDGFRRHYRFTGKAITRVVEDAIRAAALTSPIR